MPPFTVIISVPPVYPAKLSVFNPTAIVPFVFVSVPVAERFPFNVRVPALDMIVVTVIPIAGIENDDPLFMVRDFTVAITFVVGPTPLIVISSVETGIALGVQLVAVLQFPSPGPVQV